MRPHLVIFIITVFLSMTVAHGQTVSKTTSFDSTKHFVKGIYFVLKDSTGNKDSVFSEIKYTKETTTEWDFVTNKWETKSVFKNIITPFYPREEISKIDSIYFDDNYFIKKLIVSFVCNGGEWYTETKANNLDTNQKIELQKFNTQKKSCRIYLELTVKNKKGQEQELSLQIY